MLFFYFKTPVSFKKPGLTINLYCQAPSEPILNPASDLSLATTQQPHWTL